MKMKHGFLLLIAAYLCVSVSSSADVSLEFGQGSGKVGYLNQKNNPGEDVVPIGPRSFRLINDEVWVADTIGNKLIRLDRSGKTISETIFAGADEKFLVEDFAPVFAAGGELQAFWLINAFAAKLVKISLDGKMLDELSSEEFMQPMRLEIDADQKIYVADDGAQKILIFSADKSLLSSNNYEWSGFSVSNTGNSWYCLQYKAETQQTVLLQNNGDKQKAQLIPLQLEKHLNPYLWFVDKAKEELIVTYQTPDSAAGNLVIARCGLDGTVKGTAVLELPPAMARFIDQKGFADVWLGNGAFGQAPDGKFIVKPFTLP